MLGQGPFKYVHRLQGIGFALVPCCMLSAAIIGMLNVLLHCLLELTSRIYKKRCSWKTTFLFLNSCLWIPDVQQNRTLDCPVTFCRMLRRETTWACPWGKASPSCDIEMTWGNQHDFEAFKFDSCLGLLRLDRIGCEISGKTWTYYPWLIHQQRWLGMAGFYRNPFPVARLCAWTVKRLS